jgi:glycine/D-amino acid oxidase-like deaminating enzyme
MARQMERSIAVFHNAEEYLGEGARQSLALKQRGYLFCAFTPRQADQLKADVAWLHQTGLPHIEYLDSSEVAYRFGWVGEKVIAAKFDPVAGWLDSNALIHSFVQNASSAQILLGVNNTRICVESGRVTGVSTDYGTIAAPSVVIAAGAGSLAIGRSAGIELPLILRPRQSFTTGWRHGDIPADAPMLIGSAPFPHMRPEAQTGAVFGWEYTWHNKMVEPKPSSNGLRDAVRTPLDALEQAKDPRFPSITLALLARQFGHPEGSGFANTRYLRGLHHNIGYYVWRDESAAYHSGANGSTIPYQSERAIIDAHPDADGLFLSVAHVGHGIMSAPAAGEIVASKVLGRPLPDPVFQDFGMDVPWVEHDQRIL